MPTQELQRMTAERMELALIVGEVRSIETRIEKLISERPDVEEENVQLQARLSTTPSELERINLPFEGSQSSRQELEKVRTTNSEILTSSGSWTNGNEWKARAKQNSNSYGNRNLRQTPRYGYVQLRKQDNS
ncbi:hypothetical protein AGABI1DRAFT_129139 [Agaricus bisporus var. burnettii JB137-S8]|uniref:Uncharacterized protein n=1 Tax=Agaricus bisporus var. burnettii (strain JB137-S8 / ATCC MYA-4627 / FGSC 10392) TaxID=597362 RepID=K5VWK6_AGABU|nr:uncharacterized protein AGABI1DRAFT_129139 [Agaricus bisporus var. burnettii JB137-S8]EKM78859.1 hypothetical protein AGABI1DRAFT_129139 [Agaricus bisporus var. burnettii JB137-S8]